MERQSVYVENVPDDVILQTNGLCFSYDQRGEALKGINLSVRRGERIAVLGSNGAGKSTCFLNLNGVLRPDSGKISYCGKEMTDRDRNELRRHIGIVFQEADNQIIASTVGAEVSFGPMNLKLPKAEVARRVNESLEAMNLSAMKGRAPHYLSGGEKKRVCIADILAMESEIILFDEPASSLDPANAEIFENVLDRLWKMGKTLLISTHDVDFAYRWAKRVIVFAGGEVIADGEPLSIFRDQEVMDRAGLRKPVLLEVWERLIRRRLVSDQRYPTNMDEFDCFMENT